MGLRSPRSDNCKEVVGSLVLLCPPRLWRTDLLRDVKGRGPDGGAFKGGRRAGSVQTC